MYFHRGNTVVCSSVRFKFGMVQATTKQHAEFFDERSVFSLPGCLSVSLSLSFFFFLSLYPLSPPSTRLFQHRADFQNCCPIISDQLHRSACAQGVASPTVSQAMAVSMFVSMFVSVCMVSIVTIVRILTRQPAKVSNRILAPTATDGKTMLARITNIQAEVVCLVFLFFYCACCDFYC